MARSRSIKVEVCKELGVVGTGIQILFLPVQVIEIPFWQPLRQMDGVKVVLSVLMRIEQITKEPWPRIIGIPTVSLLLSFLFNNGEFLIIDFLFTLLFTAVFWQGDYMLICFFRKRYPALSSTHQRVFLSAICIVLFNVTADFLLCEGFTLIGWKDMDFDNNFTMVLTRNLGTTAIITTLYEAGYFFRQWREQQLETEQLKSQALRTELSVLKNHISPHFLFNSLNTLVSLIHENPKQASHFTEKLSEVYRYILQYKDKEIVELRTELKATEAYVYLMQIRFEESLRVNFSIDQSLLAHSVAPLTLQMLVENAVKHNIVSSSKPLSVDIYVENGKSLIVRNTLQRKRQDQNSLKSGLDNIRQRYSHLSDREVDIIETREHFLVALPLLQIEKSHEAIKV